MKLTVHDDAGKIIFRFDTKKENNKSLLDDEAKSKIMELLRAAFLFLSYSLRRI